MAFLPNIPQSTDQLSVSQGDILNNFSILGAIAGNANPSSASLNANSGFNWVYLPNNGATPPAGSSFTAGEIGMYASANGTTGRNELYINKTNQSGVVQVPATASILGSSNPVPGVFGNTGWTMLPSGIKMVWGIGAGNIGGPVTITITGQLVFATTILSVQCTIIGTSTTPIQALVRLVDFPTPNSFRVVVSDVSGTNYNTSNFMYFAVGY